MIQPMSLEEFLSWMARQNAVLQVEDDAPMRAISLTLKLRKDGEQYASQRLVSKREIALMDLAPLLSMNIELIVDSFERKWPELFAQEVK